MELVIALLLGFLGGSVQAYLMFRKPRPAPQIVIPEIKFPDINISIPEIVVKSEGQNHSLDSKFYADLAEKYEAQIEKQKGVKKAEEMTEDYVDLNGMAQNLMDDYIDGSVK